MATTLSSSTLTVKLTESILLNGIDQGGTNTLAIAGIKQVQKRIITMPYDTAGTDGAERKLFGFSDSRASGQYVKGDVRYIRITNLDNSVAVDITVVGGSSTNYRQRLDAGCSMLFVSSSATGLVDYADITGDALEDLSEIHAETITAACDLELFIATV